MGDEHHWLLITVKLRRQPELLHPRGIARMQTMGGEWRTEQDWERGREEGGRRGGEGERQRGREKEAERENWKSGILLERETETERQTETETERQRTDRVSDRLFKRDREKEAERENWQSGRQTFQEREWVRESERQKAKRERTDREADRPLESNRDKEREREGRKREREIERTHAGFLNSKFPQFTSATKVVMSLWDAASWLSCCRDDSTCCSKLCSSSRSFCSSCLNFSSSPSWFWKNSKVKVTGWWSEYNHQTDQSFCLASLVLSNTRSLSVPSSAQLEPHLTTSSLHQILPYDKARTGSGSSFPFFLYSQLSWDTANAIVKGEPNQRCKLAWKHRKCSNIFICVLHLVAL